MTRSFKRVNGELRVNHHSFMINRLYQGKGIATDINDLMKEMSEVLSSVKTLLPEAKFGVDMLGLLCENKNFTIFFRRDI